MLFQGPLISAASGSLGGLTASHNAGGNYLRARVVPTDPQSPRQVSLRQIVGTLSNRWVNTLSQLQRDAWETYAQNVPLPLQGSFFQ